MVTSLPLLQLLDFLVQSVKFVQAETPFRLHSLTAVYILGYKRLASQRRG